MPLPKPPTEVPAVAQLELLAPLLQRDVTRLLVRLREKGFDAVIRETLRSAERWRYLWGFGREYDDPDPRGVVTKANAPELTWHYFGLAADIVSAKHGDAASEDFWEALGYEAKNLALVWGGDWQFVDRQHIQWGAPMRRSPSPLAKQIADEHGLEALWRVVRAA